MQFLARLLLRGPAGPPRPQFCCPCRCFAVCLNVRLFNSLLVIIISNLLHIFLVFTQYIPRGTIKTIGIVAMLESQTKKIIKILFFRVHQHGCHDDVRWKPAIVKFWHSGCKVTTHLCTWCDEMLEISASCLKSYKATVWSLNILT